MKTQGKRIEYNNGSPLPSPGEYWRDPDGEWSGCAPNGQFCNLAKHSITEHEDGTISVTPSILIHGVIGNDPVEERWHGFLEYGVWREDQ